LARCWTQLGSGTCFEQSVRIPTDAEPGRYRVVKHVTVDGSAVDLTFEFNVLHLWRADAELPPDRDAVPRQPKGLSAGLLCGDRHDDRGGVVRAGRAIRRAGPLGTESFIVRSGRVV
jgi:hypothetical protein